MLDWLIHPLRTRAERRAAEERRARCRQRAAELGAVRVLILDA